MRYLIFLIITVLFSGCNFSNNHKSENPLVRVYDKYLYPSDINILFNDMADKKDSAQIVENYINSWIRNQLILKKAEINLTKQQRDVSKQIEDYRSSLIIYKYQQHLIQQKLDTSVSEKEISEYYDSNKESFLLNDNIIKGVSIKVSKKSPYLDKILNKYKSTDEKTIKEVESLAYKYADKYDDFRSEWVKLNVLLSSTPIKFDDEKKYIEQNSFIEATDSNYYYLVNIFEYKTSGDVSPLSFVQGNIVNILLNKRRYAFFQELEKDIYNSAYQNNQFEKFY